ncbi:MAG: hypothetical protein ILO10_00590 [Kiritimatiellae bacterium]|nr:hypothetical protein [Kiritimatiellia bacterium]
MFVEFFEHGGELLHHAFFDVELPWQVMSVPFDEKLQVAVSVGFIAPGLQPGGRSMRGRNKVVAFFHFGQVGNRFRDAVVMNQF